MSDFSSVLLCEALELSPENVVAVSRDPLGGGTVSGFDVSPLGDASPDASAPLRYYVDTSQLPVEHETGLALPPAEAPEARVWLHPADPHLPALQAVAFHGAAGVLFERIGYESADLPEFVGYRPGRRAVLRARASVSGVAHNVWVKVVKPSRVERIVDAHNACADAGLPVPQLEAWSPSGVMILANATGLPAGDVDWDAEKFIDRVDTLRAQIATVQTSVQAKSVGGRLEWYRGRLVESAAQIDAARVDRIAKRAAAVLARGNSQTPARPQQVVHGDLHFGQLFLGAGADAGSGGNGARGDGDGAGCSDGAGDSCTEITGMIDVDTVGLGDPAEDPAAFIAHAAVSALLSPAEVRPRVTRLVDAAVDRWAHDTHVRGLVAVHMLGHALAAVDRGAPDFAAHLLGIAEAVLDGGPVPSP